MPEARDEVLEQYFDGMKELCSNFNFQELQKDLKEQLISIDSVSLTSSTEDMYFRKGQINVIHTLLNIEDNIAMLEEDYLKRLEPDPEDEA